MGGTELLGRAAGNQNDIYTNTQRTETSSAFSYYTMTCKPVHNRSPNSGAWAPPLKFWVKKIELWIGLHLLNFYHKYYSFLHLRIANICASFFPSLQSPFFCVLFCCIQLLRQPRFDDWWLGKNGQFFSLTLLSESVSYVTWSICSSYIGNISDEGTSKIEK